MNINVSSKYLSLNYLCPSVIITVRIEQRKDVICGIVDGEVATTTIKELLNQ